MQPQRVTMITLCVKDLGVSRKYYTALGWAEEQSPGEEIVFFRMNGQYLSLYEQKNLERDIHQPVPLPATGGITLAQNFNSREEVDTAHAAALKAGAKEVTAPEAVFWGGYSGYVSDPDGHLWEHAHNPFWGLDETGLLTG